MDLLKSFTRINFIKTNNVAMPATKIKLGRERNPNPIIMPREINNLILYLELNSLSIKYVTSVKRKFMMLSLFIPDETNVNMG